MVTVFGMRYVIAIVRSRKTTAAVMATEGRRHGNVRDN